jgi:general secretion pathway protein D
VFVEALIVEVTSSKAAEFGIQWQDFTGINRSGSNIIGGTNFTPGSGGTTTATNIITAAGALGSGDASPIGSGLNIGIVRGTITINGRQFLNLGMLARALESDSAVNILSTPNILTLDNEEAKIIVGQNVPFITGSYSQTGTTGVGATSSPFQTIERKDVGLTLQVKPQVAEGGSVKLEIFQEVSSVTNDARTVGSADVITNKRSIKSTVLIDDGQILVLGGLMQDETHNNKSGVPVLSRIPLFGNLFRSETRSRAKTNLMVFLRPYVLRDDRSGAQITEDRYDFIRNQQMKAKPEDHLILPNFDGPELSPVGDQALPKAAPPAPQGPARLEIPAVEYSPPPSTDQPVPVAPASKEKK